MWRVVLYMVRIRFMAEVGVFLLAPTSMPALRAYPACFKVNTEEELLAPKQSEREADHSAAS